MPKGGSRQGSGRKPLPDEQKKQTYSTKLRPDQIEWLKSKKKAAAILEKLIDNQIKKEIKKMNYFIHINKDNSIDSVLTYRKQDWYQSDITELFVGHNRIITIEGVESENKACEMILRALEDDDNLEIYNPQPTDDDIEEIYKNLKNWIKNNPEID